MRLLYVCNGSNFAGAGGMEYHLIDVTGELRKRDIEIGFAVREGTYLEKVLLADEPDVFPITYTGVRKVISFFQFIKALIRFKPDMISINRERDILQTFITTKLYNLLFNKKIKLVSVFHNLGWKRHFNINLLDGAIFPNIYIKNEYIKVNNTNTLQQIIYHGVYLDKFHVKTDFDVDRKRKYFTEIHGPIIGMVGEFRKNQIELVDVAVSLRKKLDRFTFAVVGRGTDAEIELLKNKIRLNNLEQHFIVTGNVPRDIMPDVFYDFDVSITTNRYEPFGLVFIESLASSTPLVAYNSGGPVEVLAHGGGFLVDGGPKEMAEQIFQLFENEELRCRIGNEGRKCAELFFSVESMGRQHYEFYYKLSQS